MILVNGYFQLSTLELICSVSMITVLEVCYLMSSVQEQDDVVEGKIKC